MKFKTPPKESPKQPKRKDPADEILEQMKRNSDKRKGSK